MPRRRPVAAQTTAPVAPALRGNVSSSHRNINGTEAAQGSAAAIHGGEFTVKPSKQPAAPKGHGNTNVGVDKQRSPRHTESVHAPDPSPATAPNCDELRRSILNDIALARNSLRTILTVEGSIVKIFQYKYYRRLEEDFVIHHRSYAVLGFTPLDAKATREQMARFSVRSRREPFGKLTQLDMYTNYLNERESDVNSAHTEKELNLMKANIGSVSSDLDLRISIVKWSINRFTSVIDSIVIVCNDMIARIYHVDLQQEANTYLNVIRARTDQHIANINHLSTIDIFQPEVIPIISVVADIERCQLEIHRLAKKDKRRNTCTNLSVLSYVMIVTAIIVGLTLRQKGLSLGGTQFSLSEEKLPIFGVPWPVVVWSTVGSFAAMLHRFNRKPIYEFDNVAKWLITRPIQGVVLGGVVYLVVTSGLSVITTSGAAINDAAVLILSFLAGFSDRFGDAVFRTLIERVGAVGGAKTPEPSLRGGGATRRSATDDEASGEAGNVEAAADVASPSGEVRTPG